MRDVVRYRLAASRNSDRDNISIKQLKCFKTTAKNALALTDEHVKKLLETGKYKELRYGKTV
jgi:hypothetical protein